MEVICLETAAFYTLVEQVVERMLEKQDASNESVWISGDEAMHMLRITSKTTLGYLRKEGKIRYSHPQKKVILYDRNSIAAYLEKHSRDTF